MRWQYTVPVLLRLLLEYIPGWHRDHARPDALSDELLVRLHSETDFTTGGDKNHFRVPAWGVPDPDRGDRGRGASAAEQGADGRAGQRREQHQAREKADSSAAEEVG